MFGFGGSRRSIAPVKGASKAMELALREGGIAPDWAALAARKGNKPAGSAVEAAQALGISLLTEAQYRALQTLGEFDTKTSSWIATPEGIRAQGGALFCDRRYGQEDVDQGTVPAAPHRLVVLDSFPTADPGEEVGLLVGLLWGDEHEFNRRFRSSVA